MSLLLFYYKRLECPLRSIANSQFMILSKTNQIIVSNRKMDQSNLEAMSLDELWSLHERISNLLSVRIIAEKRELEHRLIQLNRGKNPREGVVVELSADATTRPYQKRKYPRVLAKYQNPAVPTEMWSGRGKQPRWLVSALKAGGRIEDFKISQESMESRARR
jgi:DNA-binding protein H-NS